MSSWMIQPPVFTYETLQYKQHMSVYVLVR